MTSRTVSSACRTRHHKNCSGERKGKGGKVMPCSCECHKKPVKKKKAEAQPGPAQLPAHPPVRDPAIKCSNCGVEVEPPHHTCPGCGRDVTAPALMATNAEPDRPACFGNCYELSSACNACPSYNPCRRASV